jgi:hypothetical protein
MNPRGPSHKENGETHATVPVRVFEFETSPGQLGKTAHLRPAKRPRQASGEKKRSDPRKIERTRPAPR